jgi:hypothetical protein
MSYQLIEVRPPKVNFCGKTGCRGCVFEDEGWARAHVFSTVSVRMLPDEAQAWFREKALNEIEFLRREMDDMKAWRERGSITRVRWNNFGEFGTCR